MFITSYAGWPAYNTSLIVSLSGQPIYNPNPEPTITCKSLCRLSSSCCVCGLGYTWAQIHTKKNYVYTKLKEMTRVQTRGSHFGIPHPDSNRFDLIFYHTHTVRQELSSSLSLLHINIYIKTSTYLFSILNSQFPLTFSICFCCFLSLSLCRLFRWRSGLYWAEP